MKNKLQYFEWIEQYLAGDLPEEEHRRFESELKVNPRLKEEYWLMNVVDEYFEMEMLIREMESSPGFEEASRDAEEAVREFLEEREKENSGNRDPRPDRLSEATAGSKQNSVSSKQVAAGSKQNTAGSRGLNSETEGLADKPGVGRTVRWLAMAASVAVLMGIVTLFMFRHAAADRLTSRYYAELSAENPMETGMPAEVVSDMLRAIEQYESSDYLGALATFGGLDDWEVQYPQISLFKGLVRLEIGQYTLAIEDFDACEQVPGRWQKHARRFRGVCYMRLAHPKAAAIYLLERTGADRHIGPGAQKLIHAVNLINTGQWKAYRQMVNPGAEGPLVLHRDDIIAIIFILVFIIIIPVILLIDILRHRFKEGMKLWLIGIVLFIPLFGPAVYLAIRIKSGRTIHKP
ncbi:MAG: hypothetical protein JXR52_09160 [Bacteroidales bacterium]|nr:hypothetical protein [Bacteroidales bacterium]